MSPIAGRTTHAPAGGRADGVTTAPAGVPPHPRTPHGLSVVIVDDHELIRQGLRRAFERAGDFTVVGEAGSLAQALALIPGVRPDVVVTDVKLPDGDGISLARSLRADNEGMGIVVLTMYAGDEHLLGAADAGASAFVNKDAPASEVVFAARRAATNPDSWTGPNLADAIRRSKSSATGPSLTDRESEVLALLVGGLSAGQIARRLYISESTVKTHISKLYDKLDATNRAQAVMAAVRLGLVADEQT